MASRLAIVGPGRVGCALGRRWAEGGIELLGFLGRDPESARQAVQFCGDGQVLTEPAELCQADAVVLAVPDDELPSLAASTAALGVKAETSWLHCSGRYGPEVLDPLAASGAAVGALHPLCPFPDAETGYRLLPGRIAVVQGDAPLLEVLARRAGLEPLRITAGDRVVYHAACALAAGGLTALTDVVRQLFGRHGGIDDRAAGRFSAELMGAALRAAAERGPVAALSGPVLRGDLQTVRAHLESIQAVAPDSLPTYVALMRHAVSLAEQRDLDAATAARFRSLLDRAAPGGES